jgi:hypothetical protein
MALHRWPHAGLVCAVSLAELDLAAPLSKNIVK